MQGRIYGLFILFATHVLSCKVERESPLPLSPRSTAPFAGTVRQATGACHWRLPSQLPLERRWPNAQVQTEEKSANLTGNLLPPTRHTALFFPFTISRTLHLQLSGCGSCGTTAVLCSPNLPPRIVRHALARSTIVYRVTVNHFSPAREQRFGASTTAATRCRSQPNAGA